VSEAVLAARRDAGAGLFLVSLQVDEAAAKSYDTAGQYVEVRTPRGNGYFVLAGDEGTSPFELLVRSAGEAADALVTSPLGATFEVSTALGQGFPIHGAQGHVVAVAVAGSALAVARPVLRRRLADGDAAITHVFVGVRSAADLPLAAEVTAWAERGAHVVLCLSRGELHHHEAVVPRATRVAGYVQGAVEHALADGRLTDPGRRTLVVAAGREPMLAAVRALARDGAVEVATNV
jgi:NAD(P)H-flavin reductase